MDERGGEATKNERNRDEDTQRDIKIEETVREGKRERWKERVLLVGADIEDIRLNNHKGQGMKKEDTGKYDGEKERKKEREREGKKKRDG
jgi:hypothetical protein